MERLNLDRAMTAQFVFAFCPVATSAKVVLRVSLTYRGQLGEFRLLLVFGQNWTVGVNVIHRQKEGDSLYLGPKTPKKSQGFKVTHLLIQETVIKENTKPLVFIQDFWDFSLPVLVDVFLQ